MQTTFVSLKMIEELKATGTITLRVPENFVDVGRVFCLRCPSATEERVYCEVKSVSAEANPMHFMDGSHGAICEEIL